MSEYRGVRLIGALALTGALLGVAACSDPSPPASDPSQVSSPSYQPSPSSTAKARPSGKPSATSSPSDTLPPPATTPVPPPTPGTINSTVPNKPVETQKAKPLDKPAEGGNGVSVRLESVRKIKAKAKLPGEVAGPALAVAVTIDNDSSKSLDLSSVVVNLSDSSDAPGTVMSAAPAKRLPAKVKAGRSASGVYVFTVPSSKQKSVTVTVSITPGKPVLKFEGKPFAN
jgi:hypothetical protein